MRSKDDIVYYEFTIDKGFGELGACLSIEEHRPGHYELNFTNGFISYVDGVIARGKNEN